MNPGPDAFGRSSLGDAAAIGYTPNACGVNPALAARVL